MRLPTSLRAIGALILREMATTYGRTAGGYLWAVVEPIAAVTLLSLTFSIAFNKPPLGRDFVLFYATGYLPFMLYSDLAQKIGVALRFSRPLLAYPAVTWMDAVLARFILNTVTHLVVIFLVLAGIYIHAGSPVSIQVMRLAEGLVLAASLGLSVGTLNTFLFEMFPVWERLWSILNRPLFIISGVLFLPELVPMPFADWLWFNPLMHVIAIVRAGIYPTYDANFAEPAYVLAVSGICLIFGLIFLRRHARSLLSEG